MFCTFISIRRQVSNTSQKEWRKTKENDVREEYIRLVTI